jgi:S1-C subfamily serine protease
MKMATLIVLLLTAFTCRPAMCQEALVKIYTNTPSGTIQGSGFLSSDHGQVLTAYHIVEGATRIIVSNDALGPCGDIRVEYISPTRDIAILSILNSRKTPYFNLSQSSPRTSDNLEVLGFPLGSPKQIIYAHSTSSAFLKSTEMSDERGKPLFRTDIDIISHQSHHILRYEWWPHIT